MTLPRTAAAACRRPIPHPSSPAHRWSSRPSARTRRRRSSAAGWCSSRSCSAGDGSSSPTARKTQLDAGDLRWILPAIAGVVILAAVIGFFSWYFTRFIIDDEELRIETGAIFKKSKKIPFERLQSVDIIQPLAARIFGLAELRLEAGAGDSTTKLRYLSRSKASRLRDYLLTRAHGQSASIRDLDQGAPASALTDLGSTDRPLVRVPPQRLIVGFLLSSEWLISLVIMVVVLVVTAQFGVVKFALGGLDPAGHRRGDHDQPPGDRDVQLHPGRVAPRASDHPRPDQPDQPVGADQPDPGREDHPIRCCGSRSAATGSTSTSSATAQSSSEDNDSSATSVLLPVATAEEAALALSRVLPGFDLDQVELHPSPRRARWVRWFDFWTLRYGWNDRVVITEHGWLSQVRDVVPHAKTQSVRIEQGPLQRAPAAGRRALRHPEGPGQRGRPGARRRGRPGSWPISQLDRARAAREAARQQRPVDDLDDDRRARAPCWPRSASAVISCSGPAARARSSRSTTNGCSGSTGAGTRRRSRPPTSSARSTSLAARRHRHRGADDPRGR